MRLHFSVGLLAVVIGLCTAATVAAQKSRWIPVQLSYSVPEGLKAGDEVTTVFVFKANAWVPKLEVTLDPLEGLEWLEGQKTTTFEAIEKGQQREVTVRLRLTGAKGRLALEMAAIYPKSRLGDAKVIVYGGTAEATAGK